MIELNKENFDAEVIQQQGPVLVDFWSPKCDPCMALLPEVTKLADEFEGKVKFCKVNVLENRRLAISQKVLGLPTILFFNSGERKAELAKEVDIDMIKAELAKLV